MEDYDVCYECVGYGDDYFINDMAEQLTYHERCPFCGKEHEQKLWLNIICDCGGKYYFTFKRWWKRELVTDNG